MTDLVLVPAAIIAAVVMAVMAVTRGFTTGFQALAGWASGAALCGAVAVFHQLATVFAHFPCPCGAAAPDGGPDLLR